MFTSQMSRLARKLSMLGILVVCLVMLSADFGGKRSLAAACCSTCGPAYDACVDNCQSPPCLRFCQTTFDQCCSTCDPGC